MQYLGKGLVTGFMLLLVGLACIAQAQLPTTGAGKGAPGGAPAYQGAGDTVSGALAWWGLRCYTATYNGNVAHVKEGGGGTHATTISCTGTNGAQTTSGDALGTTCASSCTVDILYDQSGASSCSGACNLTQSTQADQPALITNCQNSLNCLQWVESTTSQICNSTGFTQAQALSVTFVAIRTNRTGNGGHLLVSDSGNFQAFFRANANEYGLYASNSTLVVSQTDNSLHAIVNIANGASSSVYVDGTQTTGDSTHPGSQGMANAVCLSSIGNNATSDTFRQMEVGVWAGSFNGTQVTNMTSNMRDPTSGWNF